MNWQDFLTEFLTQINQSSLVVNYQPSYHQSRKDEILLGLGDALDKQQAGICLNQKGTGRHSVSEFVALADTIWLNVWQQKIADKNVSALVYVVEDFSPDTCLGLIFFWARIRHVTSLPSDWLNYVNRWEKGDVKTTGELTQSWGVLHNALAHYYLQSCNKAEGLKTCLLLVGTALIHKTDPAHLPELPCDAYQKALFQLHFEQQEYKKALQHGKAIQLAIPIEHCQHRRLLVDAFIAQEDIALGCAKYFLRNDFQHTWRKQGFSLLALYRPNEKGSGNEMVVSVDPSSGIYLRDLWQALENAENIAWQQQRPTDNPRRIQSYSEDNGELVANAPN